MGRCVFIDVLTAGSPSLRDDDVNSYTKNENFPEILKSLFNPADWKTVSMGTWNNSDEHITFKKARALLLVTRRLSRAQHHRNKRHLVLLDNLALCFAVAKGRSAKFDLLRILQRIGSISLVCGLSIRPRWIPSEFNVSDGPSRGQRRPGTFSKACGALPSKDDFLQSCGWEQQASGQANLSSTQASGKENYQGEEVDCTSSPSSTRDGAQESPSKQEKCSTSASGDPRGGDWSPCPAKEDDDPGTKVCEQRGPVPIPHVPHEVRGLLQGQRVPSAVKTGRHRSTAVRLHGHSLHGRSLPTRRRENFCSSRTPPSSDQRPFAEGSSLSQGVAKSHASAKPSTNATFGNVWSGDDTGSSRKTKHGSEDCDRFPVVLASRGRHGSQGKEHHCSSQGSGIAVSLGHGHHSRSRRASAGQDGGVRQQFSNRPLDMGRNSTSKPCQESQDKRLVDLSVQDGRLSKTVCSSKRVAQPGKSPPLSAQTRWSHGGPVLKEARIQLSESPWPLEDRQQCSSLHQSGQDPRAVESSVQFPPQVLPVVGEKSSPGSSGHIARQDASVSDAIVDVFSTSQRPRRFCLEIFAGTARVTSSLQKMGVPTYAVDIDLFPSHNVLDPAVEHRILNWIANNRVMLVWLGMPCTTFSRARRYDGVGPTPLRDSQHLWGLPHLKRHDRSKLSDGNRIFNFTMKVLHLCQQHDIPYILENPLTSMAWEMPPLQKFVSLHSPLFCDIDFCCYGEVWRKPTRLLYKFVDISSLARRCNGTFLRCSNTKRPHVPLTGKDAAGVYMTRRAQPYQHPLMDAFAALAAQQLLANGSGLH